MSASYPAAEAWAEKVRIPMTTCPIVRKLYGYAVPVLDVAAARAMVADAWYRGEAGEAAMEVIFSRADAEEAGFYPSDGYTSPDLSMGRVDR